MATVTDTAYRIAVEERIATLWRYRAWWRAHRWAEWPLRRQETDIELRALVRLARSARKAARRLEERRDPVTVAKGEYPMAYHDWQAEA